MKYTATELYQGFISIAHAAYEVLRSVPYEASKMLFFLSCLLKYVIFLDHESCSADKLNDPFRIMMTNVTP